MLLFGEVTLVFWSGVFFFFLFFCFCGERGERKVTSLFFWEGGRGEVDFF